MLPTDHPFGIPGATATLWDRFWALVDMSGGLDACWPWRGGRRTRRRGSRGKVHLGRRGSRVVSADRLALALATDGDLEKRDPVTDLLLQCCHRCGQGDDPTWCVNPRHLYWGTQWDNEQDKKQAVVRACAAPVAGGPSITERLRELQVCDADLC